MDECENIQKFGIHDYCTHSFGPAGIGCVFPINKSEMIAITMKEVILFENDEIKSKARYNFSCACFIPEVSLIVGHTYRGSEIFAFQTNDFDHPILSHYQTDHVGVYHIIYSPKSHALITIGTGIKVWNITWVELGMRMISSNAKIIITPRASYANHYDTPILNQPVFDYEKERLYLPTAEGITGFDLDGVPCELITRLPADVQTIFAYCPENEKVMTSDSVNGVCVWKKGGKIEKRISTLGPTILSFAFIDSQNVLFMNATGHLFIINIKTARIFHCYESPQRPTRITMTRLFNNPVIALCFGSVLRLFRVFVPWKVWNMNITRPHGICRCSKYDQAARILVHTNNSFIKLYSPQTKRLLVSTTPTEATTPHSFRYDRGLFIDYVFDHKLKIYNENLIQTVVDEPRDYLFVTFENGMVINYNVGVTPAIELWNDTINAISVEVIKLSDEWCYAIGRSDGGLTFLDYFTFLTKKTVSLFKEKVFDMFYHYHSNSLVFLLESRIQVVDIKSCQIANSMVYTNSDVATVHGDVLYVGHNSGEIDRFDLTNRCLTPIVLDQSSKPHKAKVTSFGFGRKFYLSSSLDGTYMVWNYEHEKTMIVTTPFPIYSISFLGPKRQILLGMETEIMLMEPTQLFGSEIDPEIEIIDNYDKKEDSLDPELLAIEFMKMEEKKRRLQYGEIRFRNTNSPRSRFRRALLKYEQEQMAIQEKGKQLFDKEEGQVQSTNEDREKQLAEMQNFLDSQDRKELMLHPPENTEPKQQPAEKTEEEDQNKKKSKKSASAFLNNQMDLEGTQKVKRRKVKKNVDVKEEVKQENEEKPSVNLFGELQSKTNKNTPRKLSVSKKVEKDITKMNFAACTVKNEKTVDEPKKKRTEDDSTESEYGEADDSEEYYEDEDEDENDKKSKKSPTTAKKKTVEKAKNNTNTDKSRHNSQKKINEKTQINEKSGNNNEKMKNNNEKMKNYNGKSRNNNETVRNNEKATPKLQRKATISKPKTNTKQSSPKKKSKKNKLADDDYDESSDEYNEDDNKRETIIKPPKPAAVDENGNVILNFSINKDGKVVNQYGQVIDDVFVDKEGHLVNENGQFVNEKGEIVDESKKITYCNMASQYDYVNEDGKPIHKKEIEKHIQDEIKMNIEMNGVSSPNHQNQIAEFHQAFSSYKPVDPSPELISQINSNDEKPIAVLKKKTKEERPKSPPLVRHLFKTGPPERRMCRTPVMKVYKTEFMLPPPNIILDPQAVLAMFGKGHTELLPLVERIRRDYIIYQERILQTSPYFYDKPTNLSKTVPNFKSFLENNNETYYYFEPKVYYHFNSFHKLYALTRPNYTPTMVISSPLRPNKVMDTTKFAQTKISDIIPFAFNEVNHEIQLPTTPNTRLRNTIQPNVLTPLTVKTDDVQFQPVPPRKVQTPTSPRFPQKRTVESNETVVSQRPQSSRNIGFHITPLTLHDDLDFNDVEVDKTPKTPKSTAPLIYTTQTPPHGKIKRLDFSKSLNVIANKNQRPSSVRRDNRTNSIKPPRITITQPSTPRASIQKDYTFLLDPNSSNATESDLRKMFPMTCRIPNQSPFGSIKNESTSDFRKSYSLKLAKPSPRKKSTPSQPKKRANIENLL